MIVEIWRDIPGYEGLYKISNYGRIKSMYHDRVVTGGTYPNGYRFIALSKDHIKRTYLVHRLVAITFINNPDNLPVVNHIDGNKQNNAVNNLEWVTQSYNVKHAVKIGLVECQCKIRRNVIITNDDETKTFKTMKDCAAFFGFKKGWLQNKIRKYGTTFNYDKFIIKVGAREHDYSI